MLQCLSILYCNTINLVLHSSPTRRSSDLDDVVQERQPRQLHARMQSRPAGDFEQVPEQSEAGDVGHRMHEISRRSDRKSTRLNSSHLGISYAVFCLKKKKEY